MSRVRHHLAEIVLILIVIFAGPWPPRALSAPADRTDAAPGSGEPIPRQVNVPFFEGSFSLPPMAIFWFGRVTPDENYVDVRAGHNATHLYIRTAAFDRRLWYDPYPSANDATVWDAAAIQIDTDGPAAGPIDASSFRFVVQLNWWEEDDGWAWAYQGNAGTWELASLPFAGKSYWRGNAPNHDEDGDDRGWAADFVIPFSSLGLSTMPAQGTTWKLAVILYDRDAPDAPPMAPEVWPDGADPDQPSTWGTMRFGVPTYASPAATNLTTTTIRHGLDGATVIDGAVGGSSTCADGVQDYWTEWGNLNYAGADFFNVQNQIDLADWPCFSKYYVTFPLDAIPPGRVIVSATLTLHQFGNAGQGWSPPPQPSYIQILTVGEPWDEATLTWNNAPMAVENISGTWVDPVDSQPPWPGIPHRWDVSRAVAAAYAAGEPLRLAVYSADEAYHSGRYFVSSDAGDWNAEGRPTLTVTWGDPIDAARVYLPVIRRD